MPTQHLDTLIIGAGISGINTAYRLQEGLPSADYAILESRDALGGTWDFWKYPGIRSDSDLHTFGFAWEPWPYENPVAEAGLILKYMNMCVTKYGIDSHIRFRHRVLSADWSTTQRRWTVVVDHNGKHTKFVGKFLVLGTGYYNYYKPLDSVIPGIDNFKGKVIHAQFWPKDYDYTDKKVILIGSGAAAVTILPAMVKGGASKVTMLQRSPSYIMAMANNDRAPFWVRKFLPLRFVTTWERMFHRIVPFLAVLFCHYYPQQARRFVIGLARKRLPKRVNWDPHFNPRYDPWKQRMCMAPDGDFYQCLQNPDKADVVTGVIKTVTETGIALEEGSAGVDDTKPQHLEADVIVAATGLNMNFGGFVDVRVDGDKVDWSRRFVWNGCMIQDVPCFFMMFGYTNASWTLGADDSARIMVRVRKYLASRGAEGACPRASKAQDLGEPITMWQLSSTYVQAGGAADRFPKYSRQGPWRPKTNPVKDWWHAQYGNVTDGLHLMG
ncbi:putative flavin-binding monooxygenase [Microdochium bolleyi]|uniref:Putative flavin-binding monooxygenase n=1 Tax=Microdochium bolleyi TaxID=196109 RepID=A0A136JJI5_9PEZI|nr:putative flavin-binding monooxygenase [Microdochium bolleyi]